MTTTPKSITSFVFNIAFALLLPAQVLGSSCFSPSPNNKQNEDSFKPVTEKNLSRSEQRSIRNIFKNMGGRWTGTATGFFCMGTEKSLRQKPDNYIIESMDVNTNSSGDLVLSAQLFSQAKETSRQENMRLFISAGKLRLDKNSKMGDVSLDQITKNKVVFTQRYRIPTRQNGTIKGSIAQEIIRTISASRSTLQIEYNIYTQGVLSSNSVWMLRKK
ncbi:hypothetical protein [Spartinivicinus ruber]|uniref:hypothetical protein n=1 Tax=Spartinivicinus ruber TaxID=2683272 RepID=UPI0013D0905F|nr:hypothetical protein [Spartinivicinus ruber]